MNIRYAVILTHNRPALLEQAVEAIAYQATTVTVVDNASDPPTSRNWRAHNVEIVHVPDQPPNLAAMWNEQLDRIAERHQPGRRYTWDVALICDDVAVPPGWFSTVSNAMREHGAAAGSTHSYHPISVPYLLTELTNGTDRMCPWAFVLRGELGLRADETMHWFYCDTDLDWQARVNGGTLIAPGPVAVNARVGDFTGSKPELAAQAEVDKATFRAKWGVMA